MPRVYTRGLKKERARRCRALWILRGCGSLGDLDRLAEFLPPDFRCLTEQTRTLRAFSIRSRCVTPKHVRQFAVGFDLSSPFGSDRPRDLANSLSALRTTTRAVVFTQTLLYPAGKLGLARHRALVYSKPSLAFRSPYLSVSRPAKCRHASLTLPLCALARILLPRKTSVNTLKTPLL